MSEKLVKHFFELYKNKNGQNVNRTVKKNDNDDKINRRKESNNQEKDRPTKMKVPTSIGMGLGMLSIKSLSFNYDKFVKS